MILTTLAIILGISFIIGIHEASHMIVSKLFGVKVLKFSLGFGPVLFSKKIGETQYQLALLPLGGYVQCAGESPEDNTKGDFFFEPWYKRSLIALAGPVANLILGFVMILGLLILFNGWPILQGLGQAYKISSFVTTETSKAIGGMVAQTVSTSNLSGPIMVTKILATSVNVGVSQFLFVLAIISLSLGLFNLFPLPALDGGMVALCLVEGIRGKRFSQKIYLLWNCAGFILLISLMLFTCFLDISKLFK